MSIESISMGPPIRGMSPVTSTSGPSLRSRRSSALISSSSTISGTFTVALIRDETSPTNSGQPDRAGERSNQPRECTQQPAEVRMPGALENRDQIQCPLRRRHSPTELPVPPMADPWRSACGISCSASAASALGRLCDRLHASVSSRARRSLRAILRDTSHG